MINNLSFKILEDLGLDKNATVDDIIRFIHIKRNYIKFNNDLLNELVNLYKLSSDVRLFNEILWVSNNHKNVCQKAIIYFHSNLNKDGTYKLSCYSKINKIVNIVLKNRKYNLNGLKNKFICLIGNPIFFLTSYKFLIKNKMNVDIVNILYHPNKFLNFIFYNKLISLFYNFFYKDNYFEIRINKKKDLKNISLQHKYDLGFHKMNFIIKDKLISHFKLGLLNDHWGQLPLFKGRSTLEYSKLFGSRLLFTNHLVSSKIDAGKIICFSAIENSNIKKQIYFGLKERIIRSLSLLSKGDLRYDLDNSQGIIFYKMHPWLNKYVKTNF